jgi:hypothetical protein
MTRTWKISIDTEAIVEADTEEEAKDKFLEDLDSFSCNAEDLGDDDDAEDDDDDDEDDGDDDDED